MDDSAINAINAADIIDAAISCCGQQCCVLRNSVLLRSCDAMDDSAINAAEIIDAADQCCCDECCVAISAVATNGAMRNAVRSVLVRCDG
jgi:hypothetical protein